MEQEIFIKTPFIKLGSLLKLSDNLGSGGMAKQIIQDGLVSINNQICTQRGKKVYPKDIVEINLEPNQYKILVFQETEEL